MPIGPELGETSPLVAGKTCRRQVYNSWLMGAFQAIIASFLAALFFVVIGASAGDYSANIFGPVVSIEAHTIVYIAALYAVMMAFMKFMGGHLNLGISLLDFLESDDRRTGAGFVITFLTWVFTLLGTWLGALFARYLMGGTNNQTFSCGEPYTSIGLGQQILATFLTQLLFCHVFLLSYKRHKNSAHGLLALALVAGGVYLALHLVTGGSYSIFVYLGFGFTDPVNCLTASTGFILLISEIVAGLLTWLIGMFLFIPTEQTKVARTAEEMTEVKGRIGKKRR